MGRIVVLFVLVLLAASVSAQDLKLGDQYYLEGEYQKAADIYFKLHEKSKSSNNLTFFNKYIDALIAMRAYGQAEQAIEAQIALMPDDHTMLVTLGNVQERKGDYEKAELTYKQAIEKLPARMDVIIRLGNSFSSLGKFDEAIATFEKGDKLINRPGAFSHYLAQLYLRRGEISKMTEQYLYSLNANPAQIENIQTLLQKNLKEEDYAVLMEQIYGFIQEYPDTDHFPELLAWAFIQQKDYSKAMRQAKALDRRLAENGARVYRLSMIASDAKDYTTAIDGFDYILATQPPTSPYYWESIRARLITKRRIITDSYSYTKEQIKELDKEYEVILSATGAQTSMAPLMADRANLYAFYLNDLDKAIALMEEILALPGLNPFVSANIKLDLGDYYLMNGDVWESTLLYAQVDKAYPEELIGQDARFRNAKLSYYRGDFDWAQTQFDILKTSTSKLIANDALDLSIFIMDNLGLDSTATAMALFSKAELLVFQNKLNEAIDSLTTLSTQFPEHGLNDDILFVKAHLYEKKQEYLQAAALYQEIADKYPDEIRADNSLFRLGELYDGPLEDHERAMGYYEKIFLDYSDSTFAIEARKRYRQKRGDFETAKPVQ